MARPEPEPQLELVARNSLWREAGRFEDRRDHARTVDLPAGWKSDPAESIELDRLAVASGLFPLYEVFEGRRYRINVRPSGVSPEEYFRRQGRFWRVADDWKGLGDMKQEWEYLENMASLNPAQ